LQNRCVAFRYNLSGTEELKNIVVADLVLVVAFSLTFSGGIAGIGSTGIGAFIDFLPIAALAVTLSFVFHELMHKYVAQHYGAIAGFRTSANGLMITLITGALGFLVGIPGATVIYASNFTKRENGIVSLAGPLTNFVVFAAFVTLFYLFNPTTGSYLYQTITFTMFISILLAFFNMLPITPLDGSKILAWNKPVYLVVLAVIFALVFFFNIISLWSILFMLVIALLFSTFYRFAL
jgi:Zn-dependent protease